MCPRTDLSETLTATRVRQGAASSITTVQFFTVRAPFLVNWGGGQGGVAE